MRFIIFVIDGPGNLANPDEMAHIDAFNDQLQKDGHWVTAAGIREGAAAKVFDNRANAGVEKEGTFFDAPEYYSGFWIIEAGSQEKAEELARGGSLACNRKVELRPYIQ